jgi:transposase
MTQAKNANKHNALHFSAGDSEGARRATEEAPAEKCADETEVVALAQRRSFSKSYKLRIVREAAACESTGAIGALLRREGLYGSHLHNWRQEVESMEVAALAAKQRGPKPNPNKAADRRALLLEQENAKLRKKLDRAEKIMEAQKKLCDLLGLPPSEEVL